MIFGVTITKTLGMPNWVRLAITFNNTTSLPLLLVEALSSTKLLDSIDPSGGAVSRAKSYFLVNSMVSNSLTFAIGPRLLNGFDENAMEADAKKGLDEDELNQIETQESEAETANEETSLLPNRISRGATRLEYSSYERGLVIWRRLPPWAKRILDFLYQFVNPPVIGTLLGALIGLVPALHRLFFNSQEEGGYFNAWLTSALNNIGGLFAALQVVVTGVKLSSSLIKMKKGESSGNDQMHWGAFTITTIMRFFVWPAISISVIYVLAKNTNLLSDDPILWFCMMMMPTGPSALVLTAMADVTGGDDDSKFAIAKFLTVSAPSIDSSHRISRLIWILGYICHFADYIPHCSWKPESFRSSGRNPGVIMFLTSLLKRQRLPPRRRGKRRCKALWPPT